MLRHWINEEYLDFSELSANPKAAVYLEQNPDKINWSNFCINTHPLAIQMIERNLDKVDWRRLSGNPAAIQLLEANPDKIIWSSLS